MSTPPTFQIGFYLFLPRPIRLPFILSFPVIKPATASLGP